MKTLKVSDFNTQSGSSKITNKFIQEEYDTLAQVFETEEIMKQLVMDKVY